MREIDRVIKAIQALPLCEGMKHMVKLPQYDNPHRFTPIDMRDLIALVNSSERFSEEAYNREVGSTGIEPWKPRS